MKITFYKNSRIPVRDFINSINIRERATILGCLKNIEDLGFNTPRAEFRQIKGKLWEIKIRVQNSGYRFFYVILQKNTLVLLHAYKKQSQKAPNKEITLAEKRLSEVLKNENHYIE